MRPFVFSLAALAAFGLLGLATLGGDPASAQTVCRGTALGTTACSGRPVTGIEGRPLFERGARGLAAVQARPRERTRGPVRIPARRQDAFGRTILERPPERPLPAHCRRDALGHLVCS